MLQEMYIFPDQTQLFLAVFLFLICPYASLIIQRIGKLDFLAVDESLL